MFKHLIAFLFLMTGMATPQARPADTRVLGISAANWEQSGVKGVEVLDVSPDSSAGLAGLHVGDVITDVNGKHVGSIQELADLISELNAGTKVTIGYLIKSHLGWMPKESVVILAKNDYELKPADANHEAQPTMLARVPAQSTQPARELTPIQGDMPEEQRQQFSTNERLAVVSEGLAVALCDTFETTNMFAVKTPVLNIHIENNVAKYDRHPIDSLFSSCNGTVTEPLHKGEVVQVTGTNFRGHEFRLKILSAPHAIQRGIGAFQHTVYESGAAELRFKLNDVKDAPTAVSAWLRPTSALPGNTASGVQVPQIREGMTQAQVEMILGAPDLKFDANGLTTYTYSKVGVAVIFKGGIVSQIANTH